MSPCTLPHHETVFRKGGKAIKVSKGQKNARNQVEAVCYQKLFKSHQSSQIAKPSEVSNVTSVVGGHVTCNEETMAREHSVRGADYQVHLQIFTHSSVLPQPPPLLNLRSSHFQIFSSDSGVC